MFSTSVVDNSTGIHKLIDMRVHNLLSKCSNKASVYFACMWKSLSSTLCIIVTVSSYSYCYQCFDYSYRYQCFDSMPYLVHKYSI